MTLRGFLLGRTRLAFATAVLLVTGYLVLRHSYAIKTTVAGVTRPLWDEPLFRGEAIVNLSPAHWPETREEVERICRLHDVGVRTSVTPVWDAIILANEMDLLEIRLQELAPVVDRFLILESNLTFKGDPKPLWYKENAVRFEKWSDKIVYRSLTDWSEDDRHLAPGDFRNENRQRHEMTRFISEQGPGGLVILSDLDEIPLATSVQLIKSCELALPLQLEMDQYLYSFEFQNAEEKSYRPKVVKWQEYDRYDHVIAQNRYLADSGVHCSFCFRHISDFIFKMTSFSHSDRLQQDPGHALDPKTIQSRVCRGENIFGMLPELYDFYSLLRGWKGTLQRFQSGNRALDSIRNESDKYRFLLPGGCLRD